MSYKKVYEKVYGKIPVDERGRSYEIHHIDGDRNNNAVENLKCVTIEEHYEIHLSQGDYAAANLILNRLNKGTLIGWKHSEESINRMKQSKKVISGETRRKLSEAKKGKPSTFLGKKHSEETKLKMREARLNVSEESRRKMSEAQKGKKVSDETRRKLSEIRKGRPAHNKGKRFTEQNKYELL